LSKFFRIDFASGSPFKLSNPLALAVAPGSKSVNLKPAGSEFPYCAIENRVLAFAAFANLFLTQARVRSALARLLSFQQPKLFST
jgi:hypothetical protein